MLQIPGLISLGGEERNFNYRAAPISPPKHTLPSCTGHLELLRQLRLKVLLKSNLLINLISPFVCFVRVPHFRQCKNILYLLLLFLCVFLELQCLGSQLGGEIHTDFIF